MNDINDLQNAVDKAIIEFQKQDKDVTLEQKKITNHIITELSHISQGLGRSQMNRDPEFVPTEKQLQGIKPLYTFRDEDIVYHGGDLGLVYNPRDKTIKLITL